MKLFQVTFVPPPSIFTRQQIESNLNFLQSHKSYLFMYRDEDFYRLSGLSYDSSGSLEGLTTDHEVFLDYYDTKISGDPGNIQSVAISYNAPAKTMPKNEFDVYLKNASQVVMRLGPNGKGILDYIAGDPAKTGVAGYVIKGGLSFKSFGAPWSSPDKAPPAPPASYCEKICASRGGCAWSSGTLKQPSATGNGKIVYQALCKNGWLFEGETTDKMFFAADLSSLWKQPGAQEVVRRGGLSALLRQPAPTPNAPASSFKIPSSLSAPNVKLPVGMRYAVVNPGDTLGLFLARHNMNRDDFFSVNSHKPEVYVDGVRSTQLTEFEVLIVH